MTKFLTLLVIATVSIAILTPVKAATNDEFMRMLAETGCKSKYSDGKKADLFDANYKNKPMTVTGEIATLSDNDASLKVLSSTLTFDVIINFANPKAGYDLEKGQRITVTFNVTDAGGCFLSYRGNRGVVQ
jgi:hypothetical protein